MADREPMNAKKLKAAAQGMTAQALETLAKIMDGEGADSVKLAAAREVLDRAHGKPKPVARPKAGAKASAEGDVTVVIRRFTDAPDPEAGQFEERP